MSAPILMADLELGPNTILWRWRDEAAVLWWRCEFTGAERVGPVVRELEVLAR